jgi:hypothetical protein
MKNSENHQRKSNPFSSAERNGLWQKHWAVVFLLALSLGLCACHKPIETSASADVSQVTFVKLPSSATRIGYWNDGNFRVATASITEKEFREMFPSVKFVEIIDKEFYVESGYGNPEDGSFLHEWTTFATKGIHFRHVRDNGGGVHLVYDRKKGRAFIHTNRW